MDVTGIFIFRDLVSSPNLDNSKLGLTVKIVNTGKRSRSCRKKERETDWHKLKYVTYQFKPR